MRRYLETLGPTDLIYLESIVGREHVSVKDIELDSHAKDQSFHKAHRPAAVIWPASAEEISAILHYANPNHIPVTPWGAGTSLEGNPIPVYGGIVIDTSRMNKILEVRANDFQVDVQVGVRYKDMNKLLAKQRLFFAPDPGANASIGGMIANNAAGTRTPGYGATKDNVLRLEVVLPSGEIIHVGTHATKTSSAYDLVHLFVGSEGTLGVITHATLKLAPQPEKFSAAVASFPTVDAATRAVTSIIRSGLAPVALEFLDSKTIAAILPEGEIQIPQQPTLLMEFHGVIRASHNEELAHVEELCRREGCQNFEGGIGRAERDRLWDVRHKIYEIIVRIHPGHAFLIVDVAVPISAYPRLVRMANKALSKRKLNGFMFGHAGDGNLHPIIPYIPRNKNSYSLALAAEKEIVLGAITLNGTATGEHGVGLGKRSFMLKEHGRSMEAMRAIKLALDPNAILNPGKIFETD